MTAGATGPPSAAQVPVWLANLAALGWRVLVTLALALVLIDLAIVMGVATASVLVAMVVSATFAPFVLSLRERGWSRTRAAAAVTLGAMAVIGLILLLIALALVPYLEPIANNLQAGLASLQDLLGQLAVPPEIARQVQEIGSGLKDWASQGAATFASDVAFWVTVGILSLFLTFFLLQDGDKGWAWALQATGDWQREKIEASGHDALVRVGGFLRGMAVLTAINAVTDGLFMVILGVPLAGPLAVFAFFLGFIPYVGGIVATAVILLVALASIGTQGALILAVLIGIRTAIVGNVVTPQIYGRAVNIHPALVLVALPAGAAVGGVIGLFAAVPIMAVVLAVTGSLVDALNGAPGPAGAESDRFFPMWLDRLGQWSWRLLVGIGLLAVAVLIATQLPMVVLPLVLALVFAATGAPIARTLQRRGWRSSLAALAVTGGAYLAVTIILGLTVVSLVSQMEQINSAAGGGSDAIDQAAGGLFGWLATLVQQLGSGAVQALASLAAGIGFFVVTLILAGLLCFYGLKDGARGWHVATSRLAPWRARQVDAAGERAVGVLGGYMIGTGAISIFGAATQFLIMVILGIPLALPLAVLSFFGGFIPYIGSVLTTTAAFLVTVKVGTPQDVLIMGIFTVVFNIVQGNVVAPLVYGRAVNLHPAVVLISIPAANAVAGVLGMFLVVPFLGVIATTWRTVLRIAGDVEAGETEQHGIPEPAEPEPGGPSPGTKGAALEGSSG